MAKTQTPAPPKGTGPNGAKLWRDVLVYTSLSSMSSLLREMVRTVDLLDELAAIAEREGLMTEGAWG